LELDPAVEEIARWLREFRGRDLADDEVETAAARLIAGGAAALPVVLAQYLDPAEDATLLAVATVALKGWSAPYPTARLIELMQRREVGALSKALIMTVLERYGVDTDDTGILGVGINLEEFGPADPGGMSNN
jgi:hypothetical protein